jgi:hypothetical protein
MPYGCAALSGGILISLDKYWIARRFGMQSLRMRFGHPIGKRNYGLSGIHPADLSALTLEALVQRTGIDPALVDNVIPGAARPGRRADIRHWPQRRALGRLAGAHPRCHFRPAMRLIPAGREFAAASVIAGHYDLVVAGGVESMSRVPMGSNPHERLAFRRGLPQPLRRRGARSGRGRRDGRRALRLLARSAGRVQPAVARLGGRRTGRGALRGGDRANNQSGRREGRMG